MSEIERLRIALELIVETLNQRDGDPAVKMYAAWKIAREALKEGT